MAVLFKERTTPVHTTLAAVEIVVRKLMRSDGKPLLTS